MANTLSLMTNVLRNAVSKQRIRYTANGYNLDLAYICENIIAMGYPADNYEGIYRNRFDDVYQFFEGKHRDHYKIYNLCSERSYDINKFHGRVAVYPFDDHNPPTIELIQKFCDDVDRWLKADKMNVAAVHCKAGKGRTGTMICCYLLHSGFALTAEDALAYYDEKRTKDKKGVTIPSQRRYVNYYSKLIRSGKPYERRTLQICEIKFSAPIQLHSQGTVHCSISSLQDPTYAEKVQLLHTFTIDFRKSQSIDIIQDRCIPLVGDVKIELYHKVMRRKEKYFHFWFNTYFVCEEAECKGDGDDMKLVYELTKYELDDAHKDKEHKNFPEDFKVQIILQPVPSRNYNNVISTTQTMRTTTNENSQNNHQQHHHLISSTEQTQMQQQQQQQQQPHQQYQHNHNHHHQVHHRNYHHDQHNNQLPNLHLNHNKIIVSSATTTMATGTSDLVVGPILHSQDASSLSPSSPSSSSMTGSGNLLNSPQSQFLDGSGSSTQNQIHHHRQQVNQQHEQQLQNSYHHKNLITDTPRKQHQYHHNNHHQQQQDQQLYYHPVQQLNLNHSGNKNHQQMRREYDDMMLPVSNNGHHQQQQHYDGKLSSISNSLKVQNQQHNTPSAKIPPSQQQQQIDVSRTITTKNNISNNSNNSSSSGSSNSSSSSSISSEASSAVGEDWESEIHRNLMKGKRSTIATNSTTIKKNFTRSSIECEKNDDDHDNGIILKMDLSSSSVSSLISPPSINNYELHQPLLLQNDDDDDENDDDGDNNDNNSSLLLTSNNLIQLHNCNPYQQIVASKTFSSSLSSSSTLSSVSIPTTSIAVTTIPPTMTINNQLINTTTNCCNSSTLSTSPPSSSSSFFLNDRILSSSSLLTETINTTTITNNKIDNKINNYKREEQEQQQQFELSPCHHANLPLSLGIKTILTKNFNIDNKSNRHLDEKLT